MSLLVGWIGLTTPSPPLAADEPADDELTLADEMVLQGDLRADRGLACEAAEYYRAVVGERPDVFRRLVEARAECLRQE